jgi:hypothetical protein
MGVIDSWRRSPPPPGQAGRLVLVCGPAVAAALSREHGGQLVPAAGPGSYRQIEVYVSENGGTWRLLEDGEPVARGTLAPAEEGR